MLRLIFKSTLGITFVFIATVIASGGPQQAPAEQAASQSALLQTIDR